MKAITFLSYLLFFVLFSFTTLSLANRSNKFVFHNMTSGNFVVMTASPLSYFPVQTCNNEVISLLANQKFSVFANGILICSYQVNTSGTNASSIQGNTCQHFQLRWVVTNTSQDIYAGFF